MGEIRLVADVLFAESTHVQISKAILFHLFKPLLDWSREKTPAVSELLPDNTGNGL